MVATPAAAVPAVRSTVPRGRSADAFGGGAGPATQCIFDGYVLSHKLHLETGTTELHR